MTTKQMFEHILSRLDSGALQVGVLRESDQLDFHDLPQIRTADDVASLLQAEMATYQQETLVLLCLDTKHRVTWKGILFLGSLNASIFHPREVLKRAILESAAAIILVHNHPSGDSTPSSEDIRATNQMVEASKLLDIPLLDHLVIGQTDYCSMKERQLM